MCYGNPTEWLALAKADMTPEAWEKFEADFDHFCAYSGFPLLGPFPTTAERKLWEWGRYAYLQGR